ncbi:MAG TPA: FHA domain-containing protein, partial [Ktedonobacteraceae bacterium]
MDKCPFCSAETRPGDNFCLNCGNRLQSSTPSPQAAAVQVEPTMPAPADWASPAPQYASPDSAWSNPDLLTIAADPADAATMRSAPTAVAPQAAPAVMNKIEEPAHLILRADNNEIVHDYVLDKLEMSIGRAPGSDILLSKDKLTSRRHATILYENGQYSIRDERSANGTFVNSQQLDESSVRALQNGDHIGIGEHELIFQTANAASSDVDIESMPTMAVSPPSSADLTFRTQEDPNLTASADDDYGTRSMNGGSNVQQTAPQQDNMPVTPAPVAFAAPPPPPAPAPEPAATESISPPATNQKSIPDDIWQAPPQAPSAPLEASSGVTFSRLSSLPQPTLPDVTPLTAALAALDGQVASLQQQLNATQEAMRNHESDIQQTSSQLRAGVRSVSDRMDKTIADVARTREQLAWSELLQLMEDVMNNPRDIEYVIKLARKARELNKVFQIHQNVLSTLAECTSLLRGL